MSFGSTGRVAKMKVLPVVWRSLVRDGVVGVINSLLDPNPAYLIYKAKGGSKLVVARKI